MDRLFKALILWAMAFTCHAAVYQTAIAPAFQKTSTGWGVVGTTATAANGAFSSGVTTQVAGKAITMPATARFAANAGQFAVSAMRLNPAGLVVGAAASWLLGYGLEYVIDHWVRHADGTEYFGLSSWDSSSVSACSSIAGFHAYSIGNSAYIGQPASSSTFCYVASGFGGYYADPLAFRSVFSSYTPHQLTTRTSSISSLAVESDFSSPSAAILPDAVAIQLASSGKVVPTESPVLSPDPVVQPLSDPYIDPVSKTSKRDYVSATPSPTPDNPFRIRIETYTQPVDSTGTPTTAPATSTPDPPQDVCEKNPEAAMCKKFDTPDDPTVQTLNKPVSITPQGGWGPDSSACPADIPLRQGGAFSYTSTCDAATKVRPITIACAWLVAALIVLRGLKES